ncbi:MAG: type II toxin-antitoxin system CcdA family antitoxin [Loktanella sp.]|nr:type II toxin-antitoxin system CcdA family antitoxin [Loktanella sp.]
MRVKVSVTLSADLVDDARGLGLNMSRIVEAALIEETKAERIRRQKDRAALDEDRDDPI